MALPPIIPFRQRSILPVVDIGPQSNIQPYEVYDKSDSAEKPPFILREPQDERRSG